MTPNGQRLRSYNYRNMASLLNSGKNWTDLTFCHKSRVWWYFAMNSLESLYTNNAVNEHSFPLVTHMAYFDTRFGRYRFLKSAYDADLFWTTWTLKWNPSFRGPKWVNLGDAWLRILQLACSALRHLLNHTIPVTTTMVTAVQRQHSCGVSGLP
jgi:hypothetical protein